MCRKIQNIERLVRKCISIPQKTYNITKRPKTPKRYREILSRFYGCYRLYIEQQILRPVDKRISKVYYSLGKKKRHTVKNQLVVNKDGYFIHRTANHRKEEGI